MRPIFIALTLLAVLLFSTSGSVSAYGTTASSLHGILTGDSGERLAGITVRLRHSTSGHVLTKRTNHRGLYHFTGLRVDGRYTLEFVSGRGYVGQTFDNGRVYLDVRMKKHVQLARLSEPTQSIEHLTNAQPLPALVAGASGPPSALYSPFESLGGFGSPSVPLYL